MSIITSCLTVKQLLYFLFFRSLFILLRNYFLFPLATPRLLFSPRASRILSVSPTQHAAPHPSALSRRRSHISHRIPPWLTPSSLPKPHLAVPVFLPSHICARVGQLASARRDAATVPVFSSLCVLVLMRGQTRPGPTYLNGAERSSIFQLHRLPSLVSLSAIYGTSPVELLSSDSFGSWEPVTLTVKQLLEAGAGPGALPKGP